jgi:hypothetical protein
LTFENAARRWAPIAAATNEADFGTSRRQLGGYVIVIRRQCGGVMLAIARRGRRGVPALHQPALLHRGANERRKQWMRGKWP